MSTELVAHELPKQYDHAKAQNRWYSFWKERGYFHSEPDPGRKPFTVAMPPPNVTGALHLGHALTYSLQDIVIRWRRMQGYNALWMPGTDHAGIATQAVVERRLLEDEKITRHNLGRKALVERIWTWKNEYQARILGQLEQLGASCDWQRTRFTLDPICTRAVRHTFFSMFKDQLVYRGKRLVNWDSFLQTAVSDDEVFHETVAGHFWHLKYPVIDPQPGEPEFVSIATTRPETMLGDTAVAVHPDPAAALSQAAAELKRKLDTAPEKERPEIRSQLKDLDARRQTMLPLLIQLRDMARAGRKVRLPLLGREIPLVADEWAKPELGSGCVKITPGHDINDANVATRQNLPVIDILNADGKLNANARSYEGLTMMKARERVVADLEQLGLVEKVEDREIELAHSDRSKTPIEPMRADQWFVKMDQLAQSAIDAVTDGRVKIVPPRYARGYLDWLSEKRDWPVSRQLWWGHRIPVWSRSVASPNEEQSCRNELAPFVQSGKAAVQVEFNEERAAAEKLGGEEAKFASFMPYSTIHVCQETDDEKLIDFLDQTYMDGELGNQQEIPHYVQSDDVLDTWFSSALWPHSTLGWPDQTPELAYYYPTSTLITARDIITLWVARMVLTGLYNVGEVPFREVYIHPNILDGYGERMSKSKGNGVDPMDVIEKFGSDSLRFSLAYLTTETQDVRMPVEFECPHCHALIEQTKKNRVLPRIDCKKCAQAFATQWASTPADLALPRGAVVSERFDLGRNFCNKLWNASRFALMNLERYAPGTVADEDLAVEDRWILSRLSSVTAQTTEALGGYRYGDAARVLYDFAWNEFCSFYVEMVKGRLQDAAARTTAQRVLAYTLDTLLRLLHPMIPFITEEVWQLLGQVASQRGLGALEPAAESIMIAAWPELDASRQDARIEARFGRFQEVLSGLREVRSRQNIPPKTPLRFSVRCDLPTVELLRPMEAYFEAMAGAKAVAWGTDVKAPPASAGFIVSGAEVFVDLAGHIDVKAEIARYTKELTRLEQAIVGKERQLSNTHFVQRAPAEVIEKERAALVQLQQQHGAAQAALQALRSAPK